MNKLLSQQKSLSMIPDSINFLLIRLFWTQPDTVGPNIQKGQIRKKKEPCGAIQKLVLT